MIEPLAEKLKPEVLGDHVGARNGPMLDVEGRKDNIPTNRVIYPLRISERKETDLWPTRSQ
jgi:hypothetical protein